MSEYKFYHYYLIDTDQGEREVDCYSVSFFHRSNRLLDAQFIVLASSENEVKWHIDQWFCMAHGYDFPYADSLHLYPEEDWDAVVYAAKGTYEVACVSLCAAKATTGGILFAGYNWRI